jgi:hypothetical protein
MIYFWANLQTQIALSNSRNAVSLFIPRAQQNAFRRRDARQQSRLFVLVNPPLTRSPTPTGFAEIVSDNFPVLHGGCFSSQSFWKAGSPRNGSQIGSSLRRAGVMGTL